MFKLFFAFTLPLVALACLWYSVVFFFRGVRGGIRRGRAVLQGLHACGSLQRYNDKGEIRFVPVFSYTTARGDEVDILGKVDFATEAEALCARRPLVYEDERPDAAMARSAADFVATPLIHMAAAVILAALSQGIVLLARAMPL